MKMETLRDLLVHNLKDLYSAENQLTKALPKMAKAATNPELKKGFETHLSETQGQIERLDRVLKAMGETHGGVKCKGMEGLIAEGAEAIEEEAAKEVRDAALIGAAQKVEHYEISGYGTAIAYAELLGEADAVTLLRESLDEEEATDKKLSALAEGTVNSAAAALVA